MDLDEQELKATKDIKEKTSDEMFKELRIYNSKKR